MTPTIPGITTGRPVPAWIAYTPHVLSAMRVVFVVLCYAAAFARDAPLFAVMVLLAVITDIMDGPIARHYGTADQFGANVDSAADLLFYLSLPVWAYAFNPQTIHTLMPLILLFGTLYIVTNLFAQITLGAMGLHNRLSRASATAGILVTFAIILWGLSEWLYFGLIGVLLLDLSQRFVNIARRWPHRHDPA